MRYQIETVRTVVAKADELSEARTAALDSRDKALTSAAELGWTLDSTVTVDGRDYIVFVDTVTYTPPAE